MNQNKFENVVYLGDGVYAQYLNGRLILTTGSHHLLEAINIIYLDEPGIVERLVKFITQIEE